jgi:hypothetical protein
VHEDAASHKTGISCAIRITSSFLTKDIVNTQLYLEPGV